MYGYTVWCAVGRIFTGGRRHRRRFSAASWPRSCSYASNVPYRANICALKSIGVTDIVALSACGSLREDMKPGEFVIVDQFIDRTFQRSKTFDQDCIAHVSVADRFAIALVTVPKGYG